MGTSQDVVGGGEGQEVGRQEKWRGLSEGYFPTQ